MVVEEQLLILPPCNPCNLGHPQKRGPSATQALRSWGSPQKGTK